MKIWVDADACPREVKEIVIKAAIRVQREAIFVANQGIRLQNSPWLKMVVVEKGFDIADQHIADYAEKGDLAITQDIPLAALLVPKGVVVINPRGDLLDANNIGERLGIRDFLDEMRSAGVMTGGPAGFSTKDKAKFAATFDSQLSRLAKQ